MSILHNPFLQLESTLTQLDAPPPGELAAEIAALPKAGKLPSPAGTWLLLFLIQYRRRQRFMDKELAERVPDIFTRDDLMTGDPLPGMPEWRLVMHTSHLVMVEHQVTGEQIVVNRRLCGTEYTVLTVFIPRWLRPHSMWDVGGRLLASIGDDILLATAELVAARVLVETDLFGFVWEEGRLPDGHRLAYWVRRMYRDVSKFCNLWSEQTNRLWLAAIIGDWPSANVPAQSHPDPEVRRVVAERFAAYRKRRISIARGNFILSPDSIEDLNILREEGVEDFASFAERAIEALGTELDLAALLLNADDSQWHSYLLETLRRTPIDVFHELMPMMSFLIAEDLLDRDYHSADVLNVLAGYDRELDRVAMLFLKYAPARALPLVQRALRHEHVEHWSAEKIATYGPPLCLKERRRMAAILSVIDRPWSGQELIAAIGDLWKERHDPAEIVPLVLALDETSNVESRVASEEWHATIGDYEHLEHEQSRFREERNAVSEDAAALRGISVSAEPGPPPTES